MYSIKKLPEKCIVLLNGELDLTYRDRLRKLLAEVEDPDVTIDLMMVEYIDSTIIHELLRLVKAKRHCSFVLARSSQVRSRGHLGRTPLRRDC